MNKSIYPIVHLSIDMQKGFHRFLGEDCSVRLTRNTDYFATVLRGRGVPTVWVGFDGEKHSPLARIGEGSSLVQPFDPFLPSIRDGDMVCYKNTMSAMKNPMLRAALEQWCTRRVIVTGVFTAACVGLTALGVLATGAMCCEVPVDLVSYQLFSPLKPGKPMAAYADYNTRDFRDINRRQMQGVIISMKAKRSPEMTTSARILRELDAKLLPQAKRAALTVRPSMKTLKPA